jgi:hypothetical protein
MPRGRPKRKQGEDLLLKSAEVIGWALGGLEREIATTRARLTALTAQAATLRSRLGKRGSPAVTRTATAAATFDEPAVAGRKQRRRKMSPEARKRISEMMTKRWAKAKREGKTRL